QISGTVHGEGRLGFLEVELPDGTLTVDPDVKIQVNLHDPGTDLADGKIRLNELGEITPALVSVDLIGDPGDGLNDDVVLGGKFEVTAFDFDLLDLDAQLRWPDINDLTTVQVKPTLGGGALESVVDFLNGNAGQIISGFTSVANTLQQTTGIDILGTKVPLLN